MTIKVELELETRHCPTCGIIYGVPDTFVSDRQKHHAYFYCPMGHSRYFPQDNEEERLRKQLLTEQAKTRELKESLEQLQKRADNGICPHCHRHFANVSLHLKKKHGIGVLAE